MWPLSKPQRPKQFVPILAEGSMLQATFSRARRVVDASDILIIGNREHRQLYLEQLPDLSPENLILEPERRGTAPCIAFAAALEAWKGRFGVMVTVPSDHIIPDPDDWVAALRVASKYAAMNDELVSIASIPDAPEVKFGYLITGNRVGGTQRNPVSRVVSFVEKPELQTLKSLLAGGRCLRNMGMIAFKPHVVLAEL
ncbi:MAG: sugar phosphate nucleotidyltransferase, partial [Rhodothermia bacterium]